MLFVEGRAPDTPTPLGTWRVERKTARIAAFNAARAARPKPKPVERPRPPAGLVLQNFPPGKLAYRLFGLAAKRIASQGKFEKGVQLNLPAEGRHFFLVVTPP